MDANKVTQQLKTGHRGGKVSKKESESDRQDPKKQRESRLQLDTEKDTGNTE